MLRVNDPAAALLVSSADARALEKVLGARLSEQANYIPADSDLRAMRRAVINRPLSTNLLSFVGIYRQARGESGQALQAMRLADRLSRRNPVSGLWLIEAASAAGDLPAALGHYHAVLSVHPQMQEALLPVLVGAIEYPEVRAQLRQYLQRPVPWALPFLNLAASTARTEHLGALLTPMPQALLAEEYTPALAVLLQRLATEGRLAELRQLLADIARDYSFAALSDLRFSQETLDQRLGTLSWSFPSLDGIRIDWEGGDGIRISAEPLSRGVVAVRDLPLTAGAKYELKQRVSPVPGWATMDLAWSADCVRPEAAERFWEYRMPRAAMYGAAPLILQVPQSCNLVRLTLSATGPDGQLTAGAEVGQLSLRQIP